MIADLVPAPGQPPAPFHPDLVPETHCALRPARVDDTGQIHALLQAHLDKGRLLPRRLEELTVHVPRFVVPHHWVRDKIAVDCQSCPRFPTCEYHAVGPTLRPQRSPA